MVRLLPDAEPHAQHLLFPRRERRQHLAGLLGEVHGDDRVGRRDDALVLDEVTEVRVLFLADRRFQRDRLLRDLQDLADLVERQLHLLGDLFRRRLAPQLLHQVAAGPNQLVDRLDHVDRDADRPGLIGDGPGDRLPDPPGGVGRELVAALVLELVDRLHEADVPLLDQVEELQPAVGVLLGDGDHEAQVGLDQLRLGLLSRSLAVLDLVDGVAQDVLGQLGLFLDALDLLAGVGDDQRHLLDLVGADAELLGDGALAQRGRADLPQRLLQLLDRQPRLVLAADDLAVGLLDPLDQLLQLQHDLVDLLLVEAHLLKRVEDLLLEIGDLLLVLLARRLRDGLGVQLLGDLLLLLPEPANLVDHLADALDVPLLVELCVLFVRVLDDLLDANLLLPQLVAQLEDLLDGDRRVEHDLQHAPLAVLDPLGDLDLALTGEQRHRPHLAQVHAHRVVGLRVAVGVFLFLGLFLLGGRRGFLFVFFFALGLGVLALLDLDLGRRVDDLDPLAREGRQPVVHLVGRNDVLRHVLVDLVVGQKALGLPHRDELALLALALLVGGLLRRARARRARRAVLGRLGSPRRTRYLLLVHVVVVGFVVEGLVFHFPKASEGPPAALLLFYEARFRGYSERAAPPRPPARGPPATDARSLRSRRPDAKAQVGWPAYGAGPVGRRPRPGCRP